MEKTQRRLPELQKQVQEIQQCLIMGRVNDAREKISQLLLTWPQ